MKKPDNPGMKKWLGAGIYGGLQRATVIGFGILSTMLLAHKTLSPEEMGVWSLYQVIIAFVEILRHGLVKNAVIKYLNSHNDKDSESDVLSSALILNIIVTGIIGVILFVFTSQIVNFTKAPALAGMLQYNVFVLLALIPFSQMEWLAQARINYRNLFWAYVVRQSFIILPVAILVFSGTTVTLNMLVVFFAFGVLMGAIVGTVMMKNKALHTLKYSKIWIKNLWSYGKFAFFTGFSNLIFRSTDTFLVSNIVGSTAVVGQQGVALRLFNMADIPSQLIGDMLFPKSAAVGNDEKSRIKYYYEKSVGIVLAIIIPVLLFVLIFSKTLITILAGKAYLGAVPYLHILLIISLFMTFLKQFGTIIDSSVTPRLNTIFTTCLAILNICTCYFFISRYGLIGAGYGLLVTHVFAFIVSQYILYRKFNIQFPNCFKQCISFYGEWISLAQQKLSAHAK